MSFITDTYLRRAERDDLDTVLAWMEDPDFLLFLYGDPAQSTRQTREKIIMMLGRSAGNTMPTAVYLLIESRSAGVVGMVSLQNISWRNRSCSIDVYMGDAKRRSGIMAAASVYRALEYAFHELNLHRVGALIYAFNRASWRIFEKAGALRELTLKDHIRRNGVLHDAYGYGLLRPEFEAVCARHLAATRQFSLAAMVESLVDEKEEAS